MPHVAITLAAGREPEQIRNLLHEVHTAVLRTTGAKPEHVRVVVHEAARTHWATGDVTLAEMDAAGSSRPLEQQTDSAAPGRLHTTTDQEQQ